MSSILACIDGSSYAPSLYQHTAWAADRLQAAVEVLNVYPPAPPVYLPPTDFMGMPGMGGAAMVLPALTEAGEAQEHEAQVRSLALLQEAAAALATEGISHPRLTDLPGNLSDVLDDWEKPFDLLLLGKRGESTGTNREALGSQLETVIRHSTQPVLVVSHAFRPIKRFLVSFDDSPAAHAALRHVVESPLLRGLACDLVMAGEPTAENRAALDSAQLFLRTGGFDAQEFLMEGDPEAVNLWEINANEIDLLVMGAYSHSRFLQFFIGSTTSEMIRSCRIPVLVMGGKMRARRPME